MNASTNESLSESIFYSGVANADDRMFNNWFLIGITVVFVAILVFGVVGNTLVCMIIAKRPEMRTATNYYLFSLAVSDNLILITGVPVESIQIWQDNEWNFGEAACKLQFVMLYTAGRVSVLAIIVVSIERYIAVCHPLRAHTFSGKTRAMWIIALIWIISAVVTIPGGFATTLYTFEDYAPDGTLIGYYETCIEDQKKLPFLPNDFPANEMYVFLFFLMPMAVLTVLYARIAWVIRRRKNIGESHDANASNATITKTIGILVLCFFIFCAPMNLISILGKYLQLDGSSMNAVVLISMLLFYLNCVINPIIYNATSVNYRTAFRATINFWQSGRE
ncbi:neuromedin-U receptor 2-like [Neocloeon triangulifer]|uniref:neuromedin-U receptor 2-like n=1 Tax=Neocloeon triangulifer TaxID=2078957 RepID=UPI00286F1E21|nr:neuromedin-U receptor 2-like [Neocloeon triangulifer]